MNSNCIVWDGYVNEKGYGRRHYNGKFWLVHRLEWTMINGDIPEGMGVLHKCDNPPCINIDHLFLGTNKDNVDDRVSKGRSNNGRLDRTNCIRGHEYTEENTFIRKEGSRECRACIRQKAKEARKRRLSV